MEDEDGAGHASKSSSFLRLEASWARISESGHKIGGGMTRMMDVASSRRSRGGEVEDERVNAMGASDSSIPTLLFSLD
jgi:hypothetical protein